LDDGQWKNPRTCIRLRVILQRVLLKILDVQLARHLLLR
jgi:hypothetical protein